MVDFDLFFHLINSFGIALWFLKVFFKRMNLRLKSSVFLGTLLALSKIQALWQVSYVHADLEKQNEEHLMCKGMNLLIFEFLLHFH